jgi:hypothetical protein
VQNNRIKSPPSLGGVSLIKTGLAAICLLLVARAGAAPSLIGQWLNGPANLADASGYSPAGTHNGYIVGAGHYRFTNDLPPRPISP